MSGQEPGKTLQQILHQEASGGRRRSRMLWGGAALIVAAVAGGVWYWQASTGQKGPRYVTEAAGKQTITVTVSATGNLQPTNKVDIGSELSGTIETVFVDDNDPVKKGQEIARLDRRRMSDTLAKSRAALAAAEAQVLQMEATQNEAEATLARLREVHALSGGKVPARTELDTAEAAVARAQANLASARADVQGARATVRADEVNLTKTSMRSPIDGVVLTRKAEPGQTVAASLQAVTLFTLAEDLTKMELQVDVDEADVAKLKEGLPASFTVDAWPGRRFSAEVTRVGLGSQTKDNVVSYPTVLRVENDDLALRPGMTATASITASKVEGVLAVPNAALRFTPPRTGNGAGNKGGGGLLASLTPRPPSSNAPKQARNTPVKGSNQGRVFVLKDGQPTAVRVTTGATDGRLTEITGGDLEAGAEVITEAMAAPK